METIVRIFISSICKNILDRFVVVALFLRKMLINALWRLF